MRGELSCVLGLEAQPRLARGERLGLGPLQLLGHRLDLPGQEKSKSKTYNLLAFILRILLMRNVGADSPISWPGIETLSSPKDRFLEGYCAAWKGGDLDDPSLAKDFFRFLA